MSELGPSPDLCFRVGMSAYAKCGHCPPGFLAAFGCPPRRRRTTAGSRLLIAVHLPSGTAQACVRLGLASGGARSALCDSDAEYRLRQCHGDRWTVSPREIAASMSASSVRLSS